MGAFDHLLPSAMLSPEQKIERMVKRIHDPLTGRTYLSQAVYDNNLALVDALLVAGFDVDAKDKVLPEQVNFEKQEEAKSQRTYQSLVARIVRLTKEGDTALHTALCAANDQPASPLVVALDNSGTQLVVDEANVSGTGVLDESGNVMAWSVSNPTNGHYARAGYNPAIVQRLLEAKPDIHAVNDAGYPPLFYAVRYRHFDEARELLARGADPNRIVGGENSIIDELPEAKNGSILIDLLRAGLNLDTVYPNGETFRANPRSTTEKIFGAFDDQAKYTVAKVLSIKQEETQQRLGLLVKPDGTPTDALVLIAAFQRLPSLFFSFVWHDSPEAVTQVWQAAEPYLTDPDHYAEALFQYVRCIDTAKSGAGEAALIDKDGQPTEGFKLLAQHDGPDARVLIATLFKKNLWPESDATSAMRTRLWEAAQPLLAEKNPLIVGEATLNYALCFEPAARLGMLIDAEGQATDMLHRIAAGGQVPALLNEKEWLEARDGALKVWHALPETVRQAQASKVDLAYARRAANEIERVDTGSKAGWARRARESRKPGEPSLP